MLSYQHGYHAGNFADVVKHVTLTRILSYLTIKDNPLFYLETHAGKGLYNLQDKQALKTGESLKGIELLWEQRHRLPEVFSLYLEQIEKVNKSNTLQHYPGSPSIAMQMLRKQDRLLLCELHPTEFEQLQQCRAPGKRIFYTNSDGLKQLKAMLPPLERRGFIFIDPSYEIKTDYRELPKQIKLAYQKFKTGVFCIWYPLVDKQFHSQLMGGLKSINTPYLRIEFYWTNTQQQGMTGCGLWIINSPYVLESEVKIVLNTLCTLFNPGISSYLIEKE